MKKSSKSFVFLILGLILSVTLLQIASAAVQGINTPVISETFKNWVEGTTSPTFAKILIFLIIFLVVFMLMESLFGDDSRWANILLGVVVGILSTAYIIPSQITALALSYTALGITLSILFPFALLVGLSYKAVKGRGNVGILIIQWVAWGVYSVFITWKILRAFWSVEVFDFGVIIALAVMTFASWIMTFMNRSIINFMTKRVLEAEKEVAGRIGDQAVQRELDLARQQRALTEGSA